MAELEKVQVAVDEVDCIRGSGGEAGPVAVEPIIPHSLRQSADQ